MERAFTRCLERGWLNYNELLLEFKRGKVKQFVCNVLILIDMKAGRS